MSAKPKTAISSNIEVIQFPSKGNRMQAIIRCHFPSGFVDWKIGRRIEGNRVRIIIASKTAHIEEGSVKSGKHLSDQRYDSVMNKARELLRQNGYGFIRGYKQKGKYPVWVKRIRRRRSKSNAQQKSFTW